VISDLPPKYPDTESPDDAEDNDATNDNGDTVDVNGNVVAGNAPGRIQADINFPLDQLVELLKEAKDSDDDSVSVDLDDDIVTGVHDAAGNAVAAAQVQALVDLGITVDFSSGDLQSFLDDFDEKDQPLPEQLESNNGSGSLIGKIIYNSVTSLFVGEKLMIQMPTWFFPAGAGPFSETASITTHGTPSPQDTFRFAEPIFIDKQQNFRVEIEIPENPVQTELLRIYGPMYMWVVLDGYMTRGVQ
jgi:hypothetical protein